MASERERARRLPSPDRRPAAALAISLLSPEHPAQRLQRRLGNSGAAAAVTSALSLTTAPSAAPTAAPAPAHAPAPPAPPVPAPPLSPDVTTAGGRPGAADLRLVPPAPKALTAAEPPPAREPRTQETSVAGAEPSKAAPAEAQGAAAPAAAEKSEKPSKAAKDTGAVGAAAPAAGTDAAGAAGGGPGKKKGPLPSPRQAIAPAVAAVRQRATKARRKRDPAIPVGSAQEAAKTKLVQQRRGAAVATVKGFSTVAEKETKKVDSATFKEEFKKAIAEATKNIKTEEQAERVMKSGAQDASAQMKGQLSQQSEAAVGPLKTASAPGNEVQPSQQPAVEPPSLEPEPLGPAPAPVSAAPVVPPPLPPEHLDYSEHRAPTDKAMAEANVTQEQLDKGNEPAFGETLQARSDAEEHEAKAQAQYRQSEATVQGTAEKQGQAALARGLGGMQGARALSVGTIIGRQLGTNLKDQAERQRITTTIEGIKNRTRSDVETILKTMEQVATVIFQLGLQNAEAAYRHTFEEEKGGAWNWITNWGDDWRELIENSLATARQEYLKHVYLAVDAVSDLVDRSIARARDRVTAGMKEVDDFVATLGKNVQGFGEQAKKEVAGDFAAMATQIDERRDALIGTLVQQFKQSQERMLAMEEELRAANQSLWDRIYNATIGLIKKILAFKDLLLSILAKAAEVVLDIISDPIGFLGNLISAVKTGLFNFKERLGTHLKRGLIEWLFGALGTAGLKLPDTLDLQGIVSIVLQILGLTYANFRARAVKIVGEPVVAALEKAADVFKVFITEGPAGLWRFIKEKVAELKAMVLDAIFDYIKEKVLVAGIEWIVGLLNPVGAFFKACKAIYEIVMFFINRGSQILALVNAVIDSVAAIAKGSIDSAAAAVENALAKTIPVAIGFLASLLSLGDIGATVRKTIDKAQAPINKAIDWVINQAVKLVKGLANLVGGALGRPQAQPTGEKPVDGVKAQAAVLLRQQLTGEFNDAKAETVVSRIRTQLAPQGLKSLEIGPKNEFGERPVLAEASLKDRIETIAASKIAVGVSAKVTVRAEESGADVMEGLFHPKEAASIKWDYSRRTVGEERAQAFGGAGEAAILPELEGHYGKGFPMKSFQGPAGRILKPVPGALTLEVVGWNTKSPVRLDNISHAERQFIDWFRGRPDPWKERVTAIAFHLTHNPCVIQTESGCAFDINNLEKELQTQQVAITVKWDKDRPSDAEESRKTLGSKVEK